MALILLCPACRKPSRMLKSFLIWNVRSQDEVCADSGCFILVCLAGNPEPWRVGVLEWCEIQGGFRERCNGERFDCQGKSQALNRTRRSKRSLTTAPPTQSFTVAPKATRPSSCQQCLLDGSTGRLLRGSINGAGRALRGVRRGGPLSAC